MRKVFGPVAVAVIIGAIALVFVFYGVYNPRGTSGLGSGAVAASVNGDTIPMAEFSREYQRRLEFYQSMMKGKADPNLLRQLGVGSQVVEELIRRKLVLQEAGRMGLSVSDEEVRDKIKELPYFKDKSGRFDVAHYESVLAANRYSPATFETMIREDLLRNRVSEFMRTQAKVSEREVQDEFLNTEDRRQVDYVAFTSETAKKMIFVADKEVDDFLKTEANVGATRAHYEQTRMLYKKEEPKAKKGKEPAKLEFYSFEEVKKKVALDLLKSRRTDETLKINKELADDFYKKVKDAPGQFKALAKAKGYEVKSSPKFNRSQNFFAGVGELPELISDSFKDASPLTQGPKLYEAGKNYVIATDLKVYKPEMADFAKQREQLAKTAVTRKEQQLYEQWMGDLRQHAKVSINKQITSTEAEAAPAAPMPVDDQE